MDRRAQILMCPPDFYGIEYEINAWMSRQRPCDHPQAVAQWQALRDLLEQADATVYCLPPLPGLPDLVFTANAALVYRDTAILSKFRHPQRQRESPYNERWLSEHGFRVERLLCDAHFEGAGDALFCGDTLFAGYRIRSDVRAYQEIGERLQCRVIPLELVLPHYYHLDTCFCPLDATTAIYYPKAFDQYGQAAIKELIPDLIAVGDAEARQFACNAVVVERTVITILAARNCTGTSGRATSSRGRHLWMSSSKPVEAPSVSRCGSMAKRPPPGSSGRR